MRVNFYEVEKDVMSWPKKCNIAGRHLAQLKQVPHSNVFTHKMYFSLDWEIKGELK